MSEARHAGMFMIGPEGFAIEHDEGHPYPLFVAWGSIGLIKAHVETNAVVDTLVVEVYYVDAQGRRVGVRCSEDQNGFMEWMDAVRNRFPGIAADWHLQMLTPALSKNETVLWAYQAKASEA